MRHKLHIKTGHSLSEVAEVVRLKYMFRKAVGNYGFWFSDLGECEAAHTAASEAFGAENVTIEKGEESKSIVAPPVLKVSKKKATKKKATKKKD